MSETNTPVTPSTQPPDNTDNAAGISATGAYSGASTTEAAVNTDAQPSGARQDDAAQSPTRPASRPRLSFPLDALPDLRETQDGSPAEEPDDKSRDEFTTVYDIIDQLESMLDEAKVGFFTPGVVKVDRDEFTEKLDELKKMLPVQLERASALMRESERRLESAQTQANAIIASAQSRAADLVKDANEQAQFLAGQENVTEIARQKARATLDQAQAKADRLTQGADRYCTDVMEGLKNQLAKLDRDVQAGLNVLYDRQREAGEELPHLDHNDYPEG